MFCEKEAYCIDKKDRPRSACGVRAGRPRPNFFAGDRFFVRPGSSIPDDQVSYCYKNLL